MDLAGRRLDPKTAKRIIIDRNMFSSCYNNVVVVVSLTEFLWRFPDTKIIIIDGNMLSS